MREGYATQGHDVPGRDPHRNTDELVTVLGLLETRFGIPRAHLESYRLVRASKKYVVLIPDDHELPEELPVASSGIPFFRMNLRFPKLTTAGAQLVGRWATKNVVHLDAEEARQYVHLQDLFLAPARCPNCTPGYVLVCWEHLPLGLGLLLETEEIPFRMKSLYPGRWSPARGA